MLRLFRFFLSFISSSRISYYRHFRQCYRVLIASCGLIAPFSWSTQCSRSPLTRNNWLIRINLLVRFRSMAKLCTAQEMMHSTGCAPCIVFGLLQAVHPPYCSVALCNVLIFLARALMCGLRAARR